MKFAGALKVTTFSSTWRQENDITVKYLGKDQMFQIILLSGLIILEKTVLTRKMIRKAKTFFEIWIFEFFDLYKCKVVLSQDKKFFSRIHFETLKMMVFQSSAFCLIKIYHN